MPLPDGIGRGRLQREAARGAERTMYCHTLVSPGTGATLQTFFFLSVLMIEDLPTFG